MKKKKKRRRRYVVDESVSRETFPKKRGPSPSAGEASRGARISLSLRSLIETNSPLFLYLDVRKKVISDKK